MKTPLQIKGNSLSIDSAALLSIGQYTDSKRYYIRVLDSIKRATNKDNLNCYEYSYSILNDRFRTYDEALAVIHEMIEKNSLSVY